jgi:hypothetical protein
MTELTARARYKKRTTLEELTKTAFHLALRGAILPVHPLDRMGREVGAHRFAEGREEGLFAEAREEPEALQLVLYRIL